MTEIKIDKGVPIRRHGNHYPFETMEVGDSFLVPSDLSKGSQASVAGSANRAHKPKRFIGRKTPEGYRVWRIA